MSLRVLVVDDDFLVARVHTRFVEQVEGFEVIGSAATGSAAVQQATDLAPDVVLLDVHLPDHSGLEVLRRLRADGYAGEVLMVTAEREVDAVQQARAMGAAGYLVKPFTQEDLRERLAAIRQAHEELTRLAGESGRAAEQSDIDRLFGSTSSEVETLPKGLNKETGQLVLRAISAAELSASECADAVGISRVTARRYLEHFADTGQVRARQQYGKVGRPERRYSAE